MDKAKNKYFYLILFLIILVGGGFVYLILTANQGSDSEHTNNTNYSDTKPTTNNSNLSAKYNDGEYIVSTSYKVPRNFTESITVKLKVKDDVIVEAHFEGEANNSDSRKYMSLFGNNYKQYVVGKKLDDLSINTIAGASLTSQAFNESISKIRQQAKK